MELTELPAHQAAARRRTADEALGRDKTTASERRAAAKAEDEPSVEEDSVEPIDEDELAEELADDDGMAVVEVLDDPEEES